MLAAVQGKTPGIKLHIVTDSETVWAGLQGKCAKWERHAWVGSRGALAHRDLWMQLWQSWQLLGDSVSIQWVPSHAGVEGNEQADKCAVRGAELSLPGVVREKEVSEVWRELGLEEMPEQEEEPEENWDAVDSETDSTDAGMMSTADSTDAEMVSENEMRRGGGLLPSLRLHVHLPCGSHKLHPRPFPPRELQLPGEGGLHTQHRQDCDDGGVSRVPGGTRLGIGLSHDCSLGGRHPVGGRDIPSAARGNVLLGRKMDVTGRATRGVCGAIGPHSRAKLRLRTAQRTRGQAPKGSTSPIQKQ